MTKSQDQLILSYANLLHRYRNPDAEEILAFVREHKDDATFMRRAKILNRVFSLKNRLKLDTAPKAEDENEPTV